MTYQQALIYINSRLRFGIKPGLERIRRLLAALGDPQRSLRCVHVAGTNGKGTTCALLASVLRQAGLRTGLYTSPFVTDFRERFQIDGKMIPGEELAALLSEIAPVVDRLEADGETVTEFELITALAFLWFAGRECDVVVLEVGLGGRFDATNVIEQPAVSVITSISLDHTAILGDTVEEIAMEKCGILKPGSRAVLYPVQPGNVEAVVRSAARERGCPLAVPDLKELQTGEETLEGTEFTYQGRRYRTPFLGAHQVKNAVTALEAVEALRLAGFTLEEEAVRRGLASAHLPARMEILYKNPLILLDGGHNPGCAAALAQVIRRHLAGRRLIAVMGMMADKDSRAALREVAPLFSAVFTLRPENPRALSARELGEQAREFCADIRVQDDGRAAFQEAFSLAGQDGAVAVCGSFYLAGELRPVMIEEIEKRQKLQ